MSRAISILIPSWNGLRLLRENLPSVLAAARCYTARTGAPTELVVVDDASQDETLEVLPREFPSVRWIERSSNGGFALACNSGFAECRFPLVALLNNDVRVEQDYFLHQAGHFWAPQVFAVTARVFEWESSIFAAGGRLGRFRRGFWSVYFNYDVRTGTEAGGHPLLSAYAVGGFATYDRDKLRLLGGFEPLLAPFHWEDIDLSYRAWKRGWEVHYEPRSIAYHRSSATIEAHYHPGQVKRIAWRNRLLFHWINLHSPSFLLRHLLMLGLLLASRILVADLDFYRAFSQAIARLGPALGARRREGRRSRRSDVEVARLLSRFYAAAPIDVYYSRQEVLERHPEAP